MFKERASRKREQYMCVFAREIERGGGKGRLSKRERESGRARARERERTSIEDASNRIRDAARSAL